MGRLAFGNTAVVGSPDTHVHQAAHPGHAEVRLASLMALHDEVVLKGLVGLRLHGALLDKSASCPLRSISRTRRCVPLQVQRISMQTKRMTALTGHDVAV